MQQLFTKRLLYFSLGIALVLGLVQLAPTQFAWSNLSWAAFLYFVLLTYVTGTITYSGLKKDNKTFITRVYGSIGIRFIFSIFPLVIYMFFVKEKNLPFIITYLLLYLCFMVLEVWMMASAQRNER